MKKLSFIALVLFGVLSTISCKKFLTVVPKTQMPQNVLFSTEGGFKDALTGAYIQMKGDGLYGLSMTQTTLENLTSSWDVTTNSIEQRLGLFNYADEGVEGRLAGIYASEYSVIASLNAILGQIDAKKDVFTTPGLYETIKSEALAMRAYCHLDVLRLFGPIPGTTGTNNMLPYVTKLSTAPNPKITLEQFKQALLKDLTEAEALIKDIDPITQYSLAQLRAPSQTSVFNPADTYMAYRYLRLNYYAIKGIQARAYLWFNDKDNAYDCAKLLIEAKNTDGSPKFRLGTSADMTAQDYILTAEHIFGLYDFNMYNKFTTHYSSGSLRKGTSATTITTQLYGNTGTDIREANLWELITLGNQSRCYIPRKYKVIEKPTNLAADFKQIPMIRISEMYLIAAEVAPQAEGQTYWAIFRQSRNISASVLPTDPAQRSLEIMKEFRKEFYAEGQSFFAYKRTNAPKSNFLFAPSAATLNYLIPVPNTDAVN